MPIISNAEIQLIEVLAVIILLIAVMPILAIIMGYKARWPIILHALQRRFFYAFLRESGANLARYVILAKDIHVDKGEIPYITLGKGKNSKGNYFLKDEAFFRHGVDPAIEWKQGDPNPINVFEETSGKTLTGYSAGETRASWNSRTAQELLRTQMNSYEMLILALLLVCVIGMFITAIYTSEIAGSLNTLNHNLCLLSNPSNPKACG